MTAAPFREAHDRCAAYIAPLCRRVTRRPRGRGRPRPARPRAAPPADATRVCSQRRIDRGQPGRRVSASLRQQDRKGVRVRGRVFADGHAPDRRSASPPDGLEVHFLHNPPEPCERSRARHTLPDPPAPLRCPAHILLSPVAGTHSRSHRHHASRSISAPPLHRGMDAAREDGTPVRAAGRARPLHQARRPAGTRRGRQQDAQARVPRGRRPREGRRHAGDLRRGAVESLPADARRRGEGRAEVPPGARGARGEQLQSGRQREQLPVPAARRRGGDGREDRGWILAAEMQKVADEVAALGRKAYIIPGGGSNRARRARATCRARRRSSRRPSTSASPSTTSCARAGAPGRMRVWSCGLVGNNSHIPLTGINVRRTREEQEPNVHKLAQETAAMLGIAGGIPREVDHARWATGWARVTRCRRRRWSRRSRWSRGSKESSSTRSIPGRRWRA